MADDAKSLLALMNGLARKTYYGQSEITDEFLKEQIYPNLSQEEFDHLLTRCRGLLKVCYGVGVSNCCKLSYIKDQD